MNPNTFETSAMAAANRIDSAWLDEYERQIIDADFSNYLIIFSPKDAADLGLDTTSVFLGYLEYILDGQVAPEDEETSEQMIALMDKHAGPGWR